MKYFIIGVVLCLVLVGGIVLVVRLQTVPEPQTQAPPAQPLGGSQTVVTTDQNTQDAQAVRAAYQSVIAAEGNPDNIKASQTSVVKPYALQVWVGDNTGGQALMKFDPTQNTWTIVNPGGGEWSVEGLIEFGVPTTTAQALLVGLGRQ